MVLGNALGPGLGGRDACGPLHFCVAGVAQSYIHGRFAWQAWHKLTSTVVLRGRRGTYGTGWRFTWQAWHKLTSTVRAGVAQTHIYRRFAWQAWHLWHWVAPLGPV